MNPALYVHVPLCRARCDYCDFFTRTGLSIDVQRSLIERSIQQYTALATDYMMSSPFTIYVGGGTPSSLEPSVLDRLLTFLASMAEPVEFTVEVNPENVEIALLNRLRDAGVNRLSVGVQSLDHQTLDVLGRHTSVSETKRGLDLVATHWGSSWNADIIVSIPGIPYRSTAEDIAGIVAYNPDHLSIYELDLVPTTVLGQRLRRSSVAPITEDLATAALTNSENAITARGYEHYEISNFARPGRRSRHNEHYWHQRAYLGVGPGAVGTIPDSDGVPIRLEGTRDFHRFKTDSSFGLEIERLDATTFAREYFMTALRTSDGIDDKTFFSRYGYRPQDAIPDTLDEWRTSFVRVSGRTRLTGDGRRILNTILRSVFLELDSRPPPVRYPRWTASNLDSRN